MKMRNFYDKMTGVCSGQKLIRNTFLNLIGLQVFRILTARLIFNIRSILLFSNFSDEQKILRKDGIVIIKNFYPNDKFEKLKNEFDNAKNLGGIHSEVNDGDSILTRYKFSRRTIDANLPQTKDLLSNPRLLDLIYAGEARKFSPIAAWFTHITHLENKTGKSIRAEAEKLHYDIFYHNTKVFYFMSDVTEKAAPFNFSPGTHRLSIKRLWYEYKKSFTYKKQKNEVFQVNEKEESFLGLKNNNIKAIVPANTLVIFDGLAFHRRGDFSSGTERSAIYLQFRHNPFCFTRNVVRPKKNEIV
jgi:hypothetical protein